MNDSLRFTSTLDVSRREELTELMFLNIQQHRVRAGIVNSIDKYGLPEIVEVENKLRFTIDKLSDVQTLFAIDDAPGTGVLAAVMIYTRVDDSTIVLLHLGVAEAYASDGVHADRLLVLRLINELKRVARSISGVTGIEIIYNTARPLRVPV